MLSITYAHCLADPTYCEDGKKGGAVLLKTLGIKSNEPIPLRHVLPHVTLREALWCLRVCKKSQQAEAIRVAWTFTIACVTMFPQLDHSGLTQYMHLRREGATYPPHAQLELCERYTLLEREYPIFKMARIVVADRTPSQIAIDVLNETIKQAQICYDDSEVENNLRNVFEGLLV